MGHGKCLYEMQRKGGESLGASSGGETTPTHRPKETAQGATAPVPSGSGMAAANSRGSHRSGSQASGLHDDHHSSRGGTGPHRYSSVVAMSGGQSGGQSTGGAGAPQIRPDLTVLPGRSVTSSVHAVQLVDDLPRPVSPVRQRRLADTVPVPEACGRPPRVRRDSSCPPIFSPRHQDARGHAVPVHLVDRGPPPELRSSYPELRSFPHRGNEYAYSHGYESMGHYRPPMDQHRTYYYDGVRDHRDYFHSDFTYRDSRPVCPGQPDPGSSEIPRGAEHVKDKPREMAISGEFVDLADFLADSVGTNINDEEFRTTVDAFGNVSLKPVKIRKLINTSYKWLEAWTSYEVVLCSHYGLRVFQEMAAYRLFVLSLFTKHKLPYVLNYDHKHRQYLGAKRSLAFCDMTYQAYQVYVTTFDSLSVKTASRCSNCNSSDHVTQNCPFRAPGQTHNLPNRANKGDRLSDRHSDKQTDRGDKGNLCLLYQQSMCKAGAKCSRKHICMGCGGPDSFKSCPKCTKLLKQAANSSA